MSEIGFSKLEGIAGTVFAAACAEQLFPFYFQLQREHGWDREDLLRKALDIIWQTLMTPDENRHAIYKFDSVERLVPHADEFDSCFITGAQNCCICVDFAIRSLGGIDEVDVSVISDYCDDAVISTELCKSTGYLSAGDDERLREFVKKIRAGDRMRRQIQDRRADLNELTKSIQITKSIISDIYARSLRYRA